MIKREWTQEQIDFLVQNYKTKKLKFCADILDIPKPTVFTKAKNLGLVEFRNKIWSNEEYNILKEYYPREGVRGVSKRTGRPASSIRTKASKSNIFIDWDIFSKATNLEDLSHILNINTPFITYFLGFLWADGTVSRKTNHIQFKIVNEDFQIIRDRIFSLANSWRFRTFWDGLDNHKEQAILEMNHEKFHEFLVLNDYHIKSGGSAIKILSKIPNNMKHYWWRGYFDGDGSFVFSGKTVRVSIVSSFEQDWSFAEYLNEQLGIIYRLGYRNKEKSSASTLNMEGEVSTVKFMQYILQGEEFGLQRKYDIYKNYLIYKKNCCPNKTSQYRGVCKIKKGWHMQIYKGKHYRQICDTELEAALLYDKMAKELFGNKANLNFPDKIDTLK